MNDRSTEPAQTVLGDLLFLASTKEGATSANLEDRTGLTRMVLRELNVHDEQALNRSVTALLRRTLSEVAARARDQAITKLGEIKQTDVQPFDPDEHSSFQTAAAGELLGFGDDKQRDQVRTRYYRNEQEWIERFRDYRGPRQRRLLYAGVWIGGQHPRHVGRESKQKELLRAFETALGDYLSEDERREKLRALISDSRPLSPPQAQSSTHSSAETPLVTVPASPSPESRPTVNRKYWKHAAIAAVSVIALVVLIGVVRPFGYDPADAISVQNSPIDFSAGQETSPDLVIPKNLSELDRPPVYDGANPAPFEAWATKHGAVTANRMWVSFIARSSMEQPTIITGARVNVLRREAPLSGTWIAPDGAGPQPVRQMYADLDATPSAITKDGNWQFPLRISRTDPEAFTMVTRTQECHCYWQVELDVLLPDGEAQTIIVDDNGKPFELTSTSNTSSKTYLPRTDEQPWPR